MEELRIKEHFPYKAQELMALVMDPARYKDISHYIQDVFVTDKDDNTKGVEAVLGVRGLPFAVHYKCDLELAPPDTIRARATKSPFKEMEGQLTFKTLPNGHTEGDCQVRFDTGWNPLARMAAGVMRVNIDDGIQHAREYLATKLTRLPSAPPSPLPR